MFAILLQCPRDAESETIGVFETEEAAQACAVRAGDKLLAKGAARSLACQRTSASGG
jgi:hypothetical protein